MARAQLERLLQAWHGPAWASQRSPPALVPSSWVVRTPSGGRPAGGPAHSPVGEGNACGRGVRRASQAALVWEAVLAARAARTARATTRTTPAAVGMAFRSQRRGSRQTLRMQRFCERWVSLLGWVSHREISGCSANRELFEITYKSSQNAAHSSRHRLSKRHLGIVNFSDKSCVI